MTIHMSWWVLPILWFLAALLIVVLRNALTKEDDPCGVMAVFIDLPIFVTGIVGAIGIVVGHFL